MIHCLTKLGLQFIPTPPLRVGVGLLAIDVKANLSSELIRDRFKLSIKQMNDVLKYINQNQDEVEVEYQKILEQAEKNRHYWENRNREQLLNAEKYIATTPPRQVEEKIWTKLHTWKNRIAQEYSNGSYIV